MKKIYFGLFSVFCIAIFVMVLLNSATTTSQLNSRSDTGLAFKHAFSLPLTHLTKGLSLHAMDYNTDGYIDIYVSAQAQQSNQSTSTLLINHSIGGSDIKFALPPNISLPIVLSSARNNSDIESLPANIGTFINNLNISAVIAIYADLDNDADIDVVLFNENDHNTQVYEHNATGDFTLLLEFYSLNEQAILLEDLNNDGLLDISYITNTETLKINTFINTSLLAGNYLHLYVHQQNTNQRDQNANIKVFNRMNVESSLQDSKLLADINIPVNTSNKAFNLPIHISLGNTTSVDAQVSFNKQTPIRFRDLTTNRTYSLLSDGLIVNGFVSPKAKDNKAQ
ncbi:FG-GAP repeat domain-containing protein [Colwelliaceae bacterium BS250]